MEYFFHDEKSQRGVESFEPFDGMAEDILPVWDALSRQKGSFLGVRNPEGMVLQCMWLDKATVILDVPQPRRRGSLSKTSTFQECREQLAFVLGGGDPTKIDGLVFEQW